jgi:uncharacterized protein YkwD
MLRTAIACGAAAGVLALSAGTAWADTPSVTINATVVPGTTTYAYSTSPLPTPGPDPADAVQMLAWANQSRANAGVGPLVMRDAVVNIAQGHSNDMARTNNLFHNDNFFTEAVRILVGGGILGENVAMASTIANAQAAFLASPHHLANMVDARFTGAGVAITVDNAGMYWVTEDFVQETSAPHPVVPQAVVAAPTPPPPPPPPPVTVAPRRAPTPTTTPHPTTVAATRPAPVKVAAPPPVTVAPASHPTSTVVVATPALTPAAAPPVVVRSEGAPSPATPRGPIVVGASVAAGLALALIARRKRAYTV